MERGYQPTGPVNENKPPRDGSGVTRLDRSYCSRNNSYVLAICGPGGAGKDEAAQYLASISWLSYTHSTSYAALDYVYSRIKEAYPDKEACYADRANHRGVWAMLIDEYNKENPTRLYEEHLFLGSDFLVGIRKTREFAACRRRGLYDLSIWICNPNVPVDSTMEYGPSDCDIAIMNTQDLEHFHYKLHRLADAIGILLPNKKEPCISSNLQTARPVTTAETVS